MFWFWFCLRRKDLIYDKLKQATLIFNTPIHMFRLLRQNSDAGTQPSFFNGYNIESTVGGYGKQTSRAPHIVNTTSRAQYIVNTTSRAQYIVNTTSRAQYIVNTTSRAQHIVNTTSRAKHVVNTTSRAQYIVNTTSRAQYIVNTTSRAQYIVNKHRQPAKSIVQEQCES